MSNWEDKDSIWSEARERMPLVRLMQTLGDGQYTHKSPPGCPFCDAKKGQFGIYRKDDRDRFKCFNPGCPAEAPEDQSEIGYLMLKRGLSKKEAQKEFLRMAVPELVPNLMGISKDEIPGIQAPPPPRRDEPRDGIARNLWHALWKKLPLTDADRKKIRETRGLNDETIDLFGPRSNNAGNAQALQQLMAEYSMDQLLEEGIYIEDRGRPRPSGQFQGWGITPEKDPKTKKNIFKLTEPIIIPYQDASGVPFYLRPHKGGVKRRSDPFAEVALWDEDQEPEPEVCNAHVFSPYILAELIALNDGECVFTEGEWKAMALVQCGIAGIACPGISFIRNGKFRRELLELLKRFRVRNMTVIFDNEDKGDPRFPMRYKENPQKRWDTVTYAEYCCIDLRSYFDSVGGSCKIGKLPDEFRVDGKADFDGILAQMVAKYGMEQGTKQAGIIFRKTMEEAYEKPGLDLFPTECRRIVERNLMRFFYKPKVVFTAGWKERDLARRFSEINAEGEQVDAQLAGIFRGLKGRYYKRKASVNQKEHEALMTELESWKIDVDKIKSKGTLSREDYKELSFAYGKIAACWERIKGVPKDISDFTLSAEYRIHTEHGEVQRLVALYDSKDSKSKIEERGEDPSRLYKLTPADMARHADFLKWCYGTGKGGWKGGATELQELVEQMDYHSFLCDIHEVSSYGFHRKSDIWFFGDVAYHKGRKILADKNGIFWHEGLGYQIEAATPHDMGEGFSQGAPMLLSPHNAKPLESPNLPLVFSTFGQDLFLTIGTYEGWLALGMTLAYAIAPELLKGFGGHPGLWMSGLMASGKSSIARLLCQMWGFKEPAGIRLDESTTPVALNRYLAQYSCLPLFLDEFRQSTCDSLREGTLRAAFDRNSSGKGIPTSDNKTRNARATTTPIICGESSGTDAATRSRYINFNVSKHNRIGDGVARWGRIREDSEHYYLIGAWLMENRPQFVKEAMEKVTAWMETPEVKDSIPDSRLRFTYGAGFACFTTAAQMLGIEKAIAVAHDVEMPTTPQGKIQAALQRLDDFQEYLYKHGATSLRDVMDETFLTQFWRDVIDGLRRGTIHSKFLRAGYFLPKEDGTLISVNVNTPEGERAKRMVFLAADAIFSEYQKDKAAKREEVRMGIANIRRDMEKQPYWIAAPTKAKSCRVHRMSMDGARHTCWVIDVSGEDEYERVAPFAQDLLDCIPAGHGGDKQQPESPDHES